MLPINIGYGLAISGVECPPRLKFSSQNRTDHRTRWLLLFLVASLIMNGRDLHNPMGVNDQER